MEIIQGTNTGRDAGDAEDQEEGKPKEGVCLEEIRLVLREDEAL